MHRGRRAAHAGKRRANTYPGHKAAILLLSALLVVAIRRNTVHPVESLLMAAVVLCTLATVASALLTMFLTGAAHGVTANVTPHAMGLTLANSVLLVAVHAHNGKGGTQL